MSRSELVVPKWEINLKGGQQPLAPDASKEERIAYARAQIKKYLNDAYKQEESLREEYKAWVKRDTKTFRRLSEHYRQYRINEDGRRELEALKQSIEATEAKIEKLKRRGGKDTNWGFLLVSLRGECFWNNSADPVLTYGEIAEIIREVDTKHVLHDLTHVDENGEWREAYKESDIDGKKKLEKKLSERRRAILKSSEFKNAEQEFIDSFGQLKSNS